MPGVKREVRLGESPDSREAIKNALQPALGVDKTLGSVYEDLALWDHGSILMVDT